MANRKLKLYVEVTNAAAQAVGKKKEEIATIRESAWKETGLETKQDRGLFDFLFDDALGVCEAYNKQPIPSEAAAQKHGE